MCIDVDNFGLATRYDLILQGVLGEVTATLMPSLLFVICTVGTWTTAHLNSSGSLTNKYWTYINI